MTKAIATCNVRAALLALVYFILMAPLCLSGRDIPGGGVSDEAPLEEISHAAFLFFIREADPESGLVRDRTGAEYGSAAAMSLPFLEQDALAALRHMRRLEIDDRPTWQDPQQGGYGLPDSFNIDENWISSSTIGIAHGPMLLMIENARTGLIWKLFMSNEHIRAGIRHAGFRHNLDSKND